MTGVAAKLLLLTGVCGMAAPACALALSQTVAASSTAGNSSRANPYAGPKICFDTAFYGPLPGVTNYCLGLRDWTNGHYDSGLELLKLAAGWGNKSAQYTLGLIHYSGHHVPVNRALGLAWLELANQRHNDAKIMRVTKAAKRWATSAERAQAKALYAKLAVRYGDKVAASRAWHHMRHWQRSHAGSTGEFFMTGAQCWAMRNAGKAGWTSQAIVVAEAMQAKFPTKHRGNAGCGFSLQARHHMVQAMAGTYFHGWIDSVSVGPLQTVPAPATPATQ